MSWVLKEVLDWVQYPWGFVKDAEEEMGTMVGLAITGQ